MTLVCEVMLLSWVDKLQCCFIPVNPKLSVEGNLIILSWSCYYLKAYIVFVLRDSIPSVVLLKDHCMGGMHLAIEYCIIGRLVFSRVEL